MIKEAIIALSKKENLSYDTAVAVMDEIMSGQASDIQMSAYLTALAMKGETIEEITASAAGMRAHAVRLLHDMDVLEIVGTVLQSRKEKGRRCRHTIFSLSPLFHPA